jgi:hypothetical protein
MTRRNIFVCIIFFSAFCLAGQKTDSLWITKSARIDSLVQIGKIPAASKCDTMLVGQNGTISRRTTAQVLSDIGALGLHATADTALDAGKFAGHSWPIIPDSAIGSHNVTGGSGNLDTLTVHGLTIDRFGGIRGPLDTGYNPSQHYRLYIHDGLDVGWMISAYSVVASSALEIISPLGYFDNYGSMYVGEKSQFGDSIQLLNNFGTGSGPLLFLNKNHTVCESDFSIGGYASSEFRLPKWYFLTFGDTSYMNPIIFSPGDDSLEISAQYLYLYTNNIDISGNVNFLGTVSGTITRADTADSARAAFKADTVRHLPDTIASRLGISAPIITSTRFQGTADSTKCKVVAARGSDSLGGHQAGYYQIAYSGLDSGAVTVGAIPVGVTNTHSLTASNLSQNGNVLTSTDSIFCNGYGIRTTARLQCDTLIWAKKLISDSTKTCGLSDSAKGIKGNVLSGLVSATYSTEYDNGNSGSAITINWTVAQNQKVTLNASCSFTFTAPAGPCHLTLKCVQSGASRVATWPATVYASGGKATSGILSTTDASVDICTFYFDGTNYYMSIIRGLAL